MERDSFIHSLPEVKRIEQTLGNIEQRLKGYKNDLALVILSFGGIISGSLGCAPKGKGTNMFIHVGLLSDEKLGYDKEKIIIPTSMHVCYRPEPFELTTNDGVISISWDYARNLGIASRYKTFSLNAYFVAGKKRLNALFPLPKDDLDDFLDITYKKSPQEIIQMREVCGECYPVELTDFTERLKYNSP